MKDKGTGEREGLLSYENFVQVGFSGAVVGVSYFLCSQVTPGIYSSHKRETDGKEGRVGRLFFRFGSVSVHFGQNFSTSVNGLLFL